MSLVANPVLTKASVINLRSVFVGVENKSGNDKVTRKHLSSEIVFCGLSFRGISTESINYIVKLFQILHKT